MPDKTEKPISSTYLIPAAWIISVVSILPNALLHGWPGALLPWLGWAGGLLAGRL